MSKLRKKGIQVLLALLAIVLSTNANAVFECKADISSVLIYANGVVNVRHSGRGDYTHICNLNQERRGVSVQTCAMWAAALLSMKKAGRKADFYYQSTAEYTSCAELPTYSAAPAPVYIGDNFNP